MCRRSIQTATAAAVLVAALSVSGCGSDRWCEFDATDELVADSFCEAGTPGYEWETDDKPKPKKPVKTTPKKAHR